RGIARLAVAIAFHLFVGVTEDRRGGDRRDQPLRDTLDDDPGGGAASALVPSGHPVADNRGRNFTQHVVAFPTVSNPKHLTRRRFRSGLGNFAKPGWRAIPIPAVSAT